MDMSNGFCPHCQMPLEKHEHNGYNYLVCTTTDSQLCPGFSSSLDDLIDTGKMQTLIAPYRVGVEVVTWKGERNE